MILLTTIQNKLEQICGYDTIFKEFDVRYMGRWIKLYPDCFPKYVREGNFEPRFNWIKVRWEIYKV